MKTLRPIARVIVHHDNQILLVRNKNAKFWYPPGGGWEFADETLAECAKREVKEETNYDVSIEKLIWVSEFREDTRVYLETFWLATLNDVTKDLHADHVDMDENGAVTEARWFTQDELQGLTVFPESLKDFASFQNLNYNAYVQ